jgi:hypothetical protein
MLLIPEVSVRFSIRKVAVVTHFSRGFSYYHQANSEMVPLNRPRLLPYK